MENTESYADIKTFIKEILTHHGISGIKSIDHPPSLFTDDTARASQRLSAVVKFEAETPDLNLFLKVVPHNEKTITFLNEKLSLYEKETTFYGKILPMLNDFEREYQDKESVHIQPLQSFFLKYYGKGLVQKDLFIALEKFDSNNYSVSRPDEFHGDNKVKAVMESLAIFHATSYCMKFNLNKDFLKEYPILNDKIFHPVNHDNIGPFFKTNFKLHVNLLKSVLKEMHKDSYIIGEHCFSDIDVDENTLLRLEKLSDDIMMVLHCVQESEERFKVLTHGDCHLWNIAFSKNGTGLPLKYFDFQLVRYTSGLIDIHHYLSQTTAPSTRKHFLNEYLEDYHKMFINVCNSYKLSAEHSLLYKDILSEYKHTSPWQFLFGFIFILPRFVDKNFYEKLKLTTTDSDVMELLYHQQNSDSAFSMVKLLFDLVTEACTQGTIDEMERLIKDKK